MPSSYADIEQCIQDAAGALHAHVRLTLTAHPILGLPGRCQAGRCNPAARFIRTSLSALPTILCSPRPVRTLDERAGLAGHPRPTLFPITILTCPVGLIDITPTCEHPGCEHNQQERRCGLEADAE